MSECVDVVGGRFVGGCWWLCESVDVFGGRCWWMLVGWWLLSGGEREEGGGGDEERIQH